MSVMAVDEFVPTETSNIVIRYNRRATQSKNREGQPRATTRVHVVCTLLRGQSQKREPPPIRKPNARQRAKKAVLTRWKFLFFIWRGYEGALQGNEFDKFVPTETV